MEVVLLKNVPKLGNKGEVKTVKNGYFRNFLSPRGKAIRVTPKLVKQLEAEREQRERRRAEMMEKIEEFSKKIAGMTVTFNRKTSKKGKLYASVTSEQIQTELEKHLKFHLDKGSVRMEESLKEIGEYKAIVILDAEHQPELTVVVKSD